METEFWVKQERIAVLLCQAKGETPGFCLEKLYVPTREDLVRSLMARFKDRVSDKIRVCAGLALL